MLKVYHTRINPTTNGKFHLGHIYMALVNFYEADRSGGSFTLRFDDDQRIWGIRNGTHDDSIKRSMEKNLARFGIVCSTKSQRAYKEEATRILTDLNGGPFNKFIDMVYADNSPEVLGDDIVYYPYHPYLTAYKVVFDFMDQVNLLIRGIDLITESSLYQHFCESFNLPCPTQIYLPRLLDYDGLELSKSNGSKEVEDLLEEKGDAWIERFLKESCLRDVNGGWYVGNIQDKPRMVSKL